MKQQAFLLDTGEDAVNIELAVTLPFHLPFDMLQQYYDGDIHRELHNVNDKTPVRVGHEILSVTGLFGGKTDLKGTWFEQGVYVGEHKYDCLEVLGMHMRDSHDQEFVIHGVESLNGHRPTPSVVRNFTEMTDFKLPVAGHAQVARLHGWRRSIGKNLPWVKHSWGDVPGCENIIYVGSGPSLEQTWEQLLLVDRDKCQIWAANEAFSYLLSKGIHADCFFCIDTTSPKRWWDGLDCSKTNLVAAPFVNPEILDGNWREVFWFNIAGDGAYYNMIRKAKPHLIEVDATKGVGSSMIESTWMKGVKRLALMGCDFCYRFDREQERVYRSVRHYWDKEEWPKIATQHLHYTVDTMGGGKSVTFIGLAVECSAVFGAAQCLSEKGVQITNVSGGGCLFVNPAASYLYDKKEIMAHKPMRECLDFLKPTS